MHKNSCRQCPRVIDAEHWRCRSRKNINKFKKILQAVVVKFCRRLQRQEKWELPSVGAENFLIHGHFPWPGVLFW